MCKNSHNPRQVLYMFVKYVCWKGGSVGYTIEIIVRVIFVCVCESNLFPRFDFDQVQL